VNANATNTPEKTEGEAELSTSCRVSMMAPCLAVILLLWCLCNNPCKTSRVDLCGASSTIENHESEGDRLLTNKDRLTVLKDPFQTVISDDTLAAEEHLTHDNPDMPEIPFRSEQVRIVYLFGRQPDIG
jgi:hypothetical protein